MPVLQVSVSGVPRRSSAFGGRRPAASGRPAGGRVVRGRWWCRDERTSTTVARVRPRMSVQLLAGLRHRRAVPGAVLSVTVEVVDGHVVLEADTPTVL